MLFIVQTIVIFKDFMLTTCLKYPMGLFFWRGEGEGGLIHGRSFSFQKLVPKRPGALPGGAYYRNFTVSLVKIKFIVL